MDAHPSSGTLGRAASARSRLAACVVLFLIGLTVRGAWLRFSGIPSQEGGDAGGYIALASHMARGHGFTEDGITSSTYRPPLFASLLGAWCYLLGSTSLATMVAFQVVVQSLCATLTYVLGCWLQPSRLYAAIGGLLIAVDPYLVSVVGLVLQEPTQMLIATLMGMSIAAWCRRPTAARVAVAGLLLGLAALAKSPFLIAPAILLVVYVLGPGFRRQLPLSQMMLASLVAAAIVVPWTLRNYRASGGRFVPINSQNVTFPIWLTADLNFRPRESLATPPRGIPTPEKGLLLTYGNEEGIDLLWRKNDELLKAGVTGPAVTDALAAEARLYLLKHPAYVLRKTLRGLLLLCSPDAGVAALQTLPARAVAIVLIHLPLAAGLLAGLVRSLREKNAALCILSLFTAIYLLVHAPAAVSGGRYSVPVLPLMIAITGYSIGGVRRSRKPAPDADEGLRS